MSEQVNQPDVVELQQTAQAAREALVSSLARLDDRVKHLRSTAVDATAASGWGVAAAFAWWLTFAIDRPRTAHARRRAVRPSFAGAVLTTVLKTASVALTGVLVYASYRHARRLGTSTPATSVGQLSSGDSRAEV